MSFSVQGGKKRKKKKKGKKGKGNKVASFRQSLKESPTLSPRPPSNQIRGGTRQKKKERGEKARPGNRGDLLPSKGASSCLARSMGGEEKGREGKKGEKRFPLYSPKRLVQSSCPMRGKEKKRKKERGGTALVPDLVTLPQAEEGRKKRKRGRGPCDGGRDFPPGVGDRGKKKKRGKKRHRDGETPTPKREKAPIFSLGVFFRVGYGCSFCLFFLIITWGQGEERKKTRKKKKKKEQTRRMPVSSVPP